MQTHLRRAVSTAYYALFHCLARCCADTLVGKNARMTHAWKLTYRALDHGRARSACGRTGTMRMFPARIRRFANLFADLQRERRHADYDPSTTFFKSDVLDRIEDARTTVRNFETTDIRDRRAFAVHVLFKERP